MIVTCIGVLVAAGFFFACGYAVRYCTERIRRLDARLAERDAELAELDPEGIYRERGR